MIFPQDEHERLLIETLSAIGIEVERRTQLMGFEDDGREMRATLRRSDGSEEVCTVAYLAGCDGARSRAREVLGIGFPGGTYDHMFYVADVQASGAPMDGNLHVDLDDADFLAIFPLKGAGRARLIGDVYKRQRRAPWASKPRQVLERHLPPVHAQRAVVRTARKRRHCLARI